MWRAGGCPDSGSPRARGQQERAGRHRGRLPAGVRQGLDAGSSLMLFPGVLPEQSQVGSPGASTPAQVLPPPFLRVFSSRDPLDPPLGHSWTHRQPAAPQQGARPQMTTRCHSMVSNAGSLVPQTEGTFSRLRHFSPLCLQQKHSKILCGRYFYSSAKWPPSLLLASASSTNFLPLSQTLSLALSPGGLLQWCGSWGENGMDGPPMETIL